MRICRVADYKINIFKNQQLLFILVLSYIQTLQNTYLKSGVMNKFNKGS